MSNSDIRLLQAELRYIRTEAAEILKHVKKTNGRVRSLELWRSYLLGGMTVVGAVMAFLFEKVL